MIADLLLNKPIADPFRRLDNLMHLINQNNESDWPFSSLSFGQCLTNIWEDETHYVVEMELPGVLEKDIELSIAGTELTIKVNQPVPEDDESRTYVRQERSCGVTTRVISLPLEQSPAEMNATLEYGVLTIRFKKPAEATVKRIDVVQK